MVKVYNPDHPSQYIELPVNMEENKALVLQKYKEKANQIARELNPTIFNDKEV